MRARLGSILWAVICSAWLSGWAQPLERIPNPRQTDGSWVVDSAGMLDAAQSARLNRLIDELERDTGVEIAVVILRRTVDATPKEYATALLNRWGVGKRDADNGVLMLVALEERRVEIEVGYGLESILTDASVGEILDREVVPRFRSGNIADGVRAGVQALAERIRMAQTSGAYEPTPNSQPNHSPAPMIALMVLGSGAIVLLAFALRERPPKCPICQQPMRLLDEQADDFYLDERQRTEEQLGSVNYLVWRCEPCETLEILPKVALFRNYSECPDCGGYTVRETARVARQPTYRRSGLEIIAYACQNPHCGYRRERQRKLPRLDAADTGWGYTTRAPQRGDDWFIGGGFGGGSGGWSSGGGFGGGSSGGGGAGRSW
ncbi:MAG: TPM domain-containing protein [Fimbriimonadales bacterium]